MLTLASEGVDDQPAILRDVENDAAMRHLVPEPSVTVMTRIKEAKPISGNRDRD
jgi:hypothetical protein